jgi:hypothetical protein
MCDSTLKGEGRGPPGDMILHRAKQSVRHTHHKLQVGWSGSHVSDALVAYRTNQDESAQAVRSLRAWPYVPTSANRSESVDSCEQVLKCVVHAFGVPRRVGQGVAIRSSADRQSSVVARNNVDQVEATHQRS